MKQYLNGRNHGHCGLESHIVTQTCDKSVIPSQLTADATTTTTIITSFDFISFALFHQFFCLL